MLLKNAAMFVLELLIQLKNRPCLRISRFVFISLTHWNFDWKIRGKKVHFKLQILFQQRQCHPNPFVHSLYKWDRHSHLNQFENLSSKKIQHVPKFSTDISKVLLETTANFFIMEKYYFLGFHRQETSAIHKQDLANFFVYYVDI